MYIFICITPYPLKSFQAHATLLLTPVLLQESVARLREPGKTLVSMVYIPSSHFFENNLLVKIVGMKLGSANTVWCQGQLRIGQVELGLGLGQGYVRVKLELGQGYVSLDKVIQIGMMHCQISKCKLQKYLILPYKQFLPITQKNQSVYEMSDWTNGLF